MTLFRHPRLISFTNLALALLMIMVAARSDASCISSVPGPAASSQTMENCTGMNADPVGSALPGQTHHSDENPPGICHLGCPIVLTVAETKNGHQRIYSPRYLREQQPMMVGMDAIPQTPPPRFG